MKQNGTPAKYRITVVVMKAALRLMEDEATIDKGRRIFTEKLSFLPKESYGTLQLCESIDGADCFLSDPSIVIRSDGERAVRWNCRKAGKNSSVPLFLEGTGKMEIRAAKNLAEKAESWLVRRAEKEMEESLGLERKAALRDAQIRKQQEQI